MQIDDPDFIVGQLRLRAKSEAAICKSMARDKSLRNSDGQHDDIYMSIELENTLPWRAADLIERLSGLSLPGRPEE